jgi:3-dehydroquinate synthase
VASINVDLGKDSYTIEIERGLIHRVGEKIRALTKAEKIAVITDDHVEPLYGNTIREVLTKAGFDVRVIAIPAGETSKNLQVLSDVYDALSEFDMSRSDAIVTLSGGVPGDLGGFAAATYMRGIPFFQIPTTILAQIDSSVGGKVAVDLPSGKNLAGAFYQPKGVFIDPDLLKTLPPRYIHDGLAEAVKYGCIGDPELFEIFESLETEEDLDRHMEEIILHSVLQKTKVVEEDEFDTGKTAGPELWPYHRPCGGTVFPLLHLYPRRRGGYGHVPHDRTDGKDGYHGKRNSQPHYPGASQAVPAHVHRRSGGGADSPDHA